MEIEDPGDLEIGKSKNQRPGVASTTCAEII